MIIGADISTLPETEALGAKFYDKGKPCGVLAALEKYGISSIRLRLWVDPFDEKGNSYLGGGCDIKTVLALAKRVKASGMSFMLDFHYSDFWTDPGKQFIPKAWRGLDLAALCKKIYNYTLDTLNQFKAEGVYPDFVQTGNEITGGMLWPTGRILYDEELKQRTGYASLCALLLSATEAVRKSGDAKIVLHLERSGDNGVYREWFDNITAAGVEFDVIGASYYPHWHGSFDALVFNLNDMVSRYNKDVMVVETSYPFTNEHYGGGQSIKLVMNETLPVPEGGVRPFPFTKEGQAAFVAELVTRLKGIKDNRCTALYYWEPAWLPVEGSSWASEGGRAYVCQQSDRGGNEWANQCLFDYEGNSLPALEVFNKIKD